MSNTISVGQITVTMEPASATIACGHVSCAVGLAAGKRFFDELTKIHEALLAAYEVLAQPGDVQRPASPEELHLANKLIELEITHALRNKKMP